MVLYYVRLYLFQRWKLHFTKYPGIGGNDSAEFKQYNAIYISKWMSHSSLIINATPGFDILYSFLFSAEF